MTNEPADMLEAAAKKLREMAIAAEGDSPTAWFAEPYLVDDAGLRQEDAAYIAAMSPSVALALADLLEHTAMCVDSGEATGEAQTLDVARAILGGG